MGLPMCFSTVHPADAIADSAMAEAGGSGSWRLCTVPETAKLHMAVIVFQLGYAGNHIIFQAALNMGVSKFVLPLYRNSIAVLVLFPFAYILEKYDSYLYEIYLAPVQLNQYHIVLVLLIVLLQFCLVQER